MIPRKIIAFVLLFGMCFAAAAGAVKEPDGYLLEEVTLDIKGLTNKKLLYDAMDIDPKRVFETFDELESYVEERRQLLVNMRIFDEITYEILPADGMYRYRAEFFVDDSFTTLPIPYSTYDSNYGVKVGLKLFDSNLLGTLSDMKLTTFMSQTSRAPDSWEYKHYFNELIWNNIPLFGSTLDSTTVFSIKEGGSEGLYGGSLETSLVLTDLPLFSKNFSLTADYQIDQLVEGDLEQWGNPDYTVGFSWERLPFIDHDITIGATIDLFETNEETGINTYDISLDTTFHGLEFLFTEFDFITGVGYQLSDDELPYSLSSVYFGLKDSYNLPLSMKYQTTTKFVLEPRNSLNSYFIFKNTLSRNRINWRHNYRTGLDFSISNSITYDTDLLYGSSEGLPSYTSVSATSFLILGDLLNLGARVKAFYAPDDPTYFMNDSGSSPGGLMRGILDKRIPNKESLYGGILNTNMVFTLIDFPDFAELLVSPFLDVGIFSSAETIEEYDTYLSGGVEIYWIFDRYKSYPFNITVGADLKDVYDVFQGTGEVGDVEYEILMSLNLFY